MTSRSSICRLSLLLVALLFAILPGFAVSEELSPEEEAARKAADPLGDVRAIMTDNTAAFGAGESEDDINYAFQIQPVYAIPKDRMNMILRAVIPIAGIEPGTVVPPIGGGPRPEDDSQWGLSDTMVQYFFSPKSEGTIKWGIGPQVSLKTHTSDRTAGPGWGGGLAGVIFGGAGNFSLGAIAMQHWGDSGNFSIFTLQPIIMYMMPNLPGAYIGFNNSLTYNWKTESSDDAWSIPLGLTFGKTLVLESGNYADLSVGAYANVVRPDLAAKWQLKFGYSYFFN